MDTELISVSELEEIHPIDAALLQTYDGTAIFGDYQLLRPLGEGGMADVWHALWRRPSGEPVAVALKRILPHLSRERGVVRMFLDEARLAMRLQHPNIVRALDAGSVAERPFIALELLDGVDLRQLFKAASSPLPLGFALYVARELCRALDYAHRLRDERGNWLGVVHRDVSPSNVMLGSDGSVKLVDFGIAKVLHGQPGDKTQTQLGVVKGKVGYFAPELLEGVSFDGRIDLFSLGVVLHELLTQRRLFLGGDSAASVALVRACQVPAPSQLNPQVPPELDAIVARALKRLPGERYGSAAEMGAALDGALGRHAWGAEQTAALVRMYRQGKAYFERSAALSLPHPLSTASEVATAIEGDWIASGLAAIGDDATELQLPTTEPKPQTRTRLLVRATLPSRRLSIGAGLLGLAALSALLRPSSGAPPPSSLPLVAIAAPATAPAPVVTPLCPTPPDPTRPSVVSEANESEEVPSPRRGRPSVVSEANESEEVPSPRRDPPRPRPVRPKPHPPRVARPKRPPRRVTPHVPPVELNRQNLLNPFAVRAD